MKLLEEFDEGSEIVHSKLVTEVTGKHLYFFPIECLSPALGKIFSQPKTLVTLGFVEKYDEGQKLVEGMDNYCLVIHHPKTRSCWAMYQQNFYSGDAGTVLKLDADHSYVVEPLKTYLRRFAPVSESEEADNERIENVDRSDTSFLESED